MFQPDFIAIFRETSMTYAAYVIEDSLKITKAETCRRINQ